MGVADTRDNDGIALSYALGIARFESPRGPAWFKGGRPDASHAPCRRVDEVPH
jgi:hypothetical protein